MFGQGYTSLLCAHARVALWLGFVLCSFKRWWGPRSGWPACDSSWRALCRAAAVCRLATDGSAGQPRLAFPLQPARLASGRSWNSDSWCSCQLLQSRSRETPYLQVSTWCSTVLKCLCCFCHVIRKKVVPCSFYQSTGKNSITLKREWVRYNVDL